MRSRFLLDEIPGFESERLIFHGHRAEDLAESAAMWADPSVNRYISGRPQTVEDCWSRILRYVGHWALAGYGYWAVREKSTGRFVGEVGFADLRREIVPSFDGVPEIGWVLTPSAQGRGYATEAARAAIAWLESKLGPTPMVCIIAPEHTASIRVAEKCGFVERARTTYKGDATILFERR
jgi:RimJ/RimL family protein N-acetyltransferase